MRNSPLRLIMPQVWAASSPIRNAKINSGRYAGTRPSSVILKVTQDARGYLPMNTTPSLCVRLKPLRSYRLRSAAADAWLNRLEIVSWDQFESVIDRIPPTIMTSAARAFAKRLLELNRLALLSRSFGYA